MVKALAFVVVFTLASMSAGQNPYDGAKDFILGYFTGFQESTYNLTDTCLPADFQTQMQADWDAIFGTDNIEKVLENALKFEADLERVNEDCLLWVLPVSLIQSLETKGLDTLRDFIEHFGDIALDMIFTMENIDKDPFEAGRYFGSALGYFLVKVPVGPQRLRAAPVIPKPNYLDGFMNFTKGLIHGLQLNNTGTSNCLTSFNTISASVDTMGSVAFHCLLLDMDACNQLGVSLENVLMVLVSFSTNCNFQKLFSDMGRLLTLDGWVTLYKNMYWYQTQIRQAYSDLLIAYQAGNYYDEGINLGDIIQLAFSFTVNVLLLCAAASTQVSVFRLFQIESQGASAGSQVSNLNYVGVHHSKGAEVQRKLVVLRLHEASRDVISSLIAFKPSGFLILLPSETLPQDQMAVWKDLEDYFGSQVFPFPVYFAWDTPELSNLYGELAAQQADDQDLLNFVVSTDEKPALKKLTLENIYGFVLEYSESLPSVALVAHYDAFSVVPELAQGLNNNGSGVIALLELARIFYRQYGQNAPSYNLLLLLTSAGTLNFEGSRHWLNVEDPVLSQIVNSIQFALSLDTIGDGGKLTVHVSRFQKEGENEVLRFYTAMNATANATGIPLNYVKKKVNVADQFVPWQHENFARRKVVGATLSSLETPRSRLLDHSNIFDTTLDYQALERNIKFVAECVAKYLFNAEEKVRLTQPGYILYEKPDLVKRESLEDWGRRLRNMTRYPTKLTPGSPVTDSLVMALQNFTGKSLKKKSFALEDTTLYASKVETLNIYRVKPPILEFYVFLSVMGYIAALWVLVTMCGKVSLVSKKEKKR